MLAEYLMKTINDLKELSRAFPGMKNELSVTIPGFIADKGPNMQAALALLESEQGILRFRCQAH